VTFIEAMDNLMPGFDKEIARMADRLLIKGRPIDYHTGVIATKVTPGVPGEGAAVPGRGGQRASPGDIHDLMSHIRQISRSVDRGALLPCACEPGWVPVLCCAGIWPLTLSRLADPLAVRGCCVAAAGVKPVTIELTDFKTKKVVDTLEVDACMVATGRAPYTQGLNLSAIGVETDRRGFVPVNEKMEVTDASGKVGAGDREAQRPPGQCCVACCAACVADSAS
jgi:hypothetical protein